MDWPLRAVPAGCFESPIPSHECLQHVRDQHRRVYGLAIRLSVQRGVAIEVGLQAGRARKVSLMLSVFGSGPSRSFLAVLIALFPD